jgi:hypothetical protein
MGHNAAIALTRRCNRQGDEFLDLTRQSAFGHRGLGEIGECTKNVGDFVA